MWLKKKTQKKNSADPALCGSTQFLTHLAIVDKLTGTVDSPYLDFAYLE